ncbi:MAG: septum formation family protein [Chloroflexota bacterium]
MANSWTCARCSAQNDEAAVSCATCGLIRGGVVVAADAATTAPGDPGIAGAAPPPAPGAPAPGGWPGAQPAAQPQSAGKQVAKGILANVGARVIVIGVIAVIAVVAGLFINAGRDSSGTINKSGEVPATELRLGDCWDMQGDSASFDENSVITKTTGKPCAEAHRYEVFYVGTFPEQSTYPTNAEFQDWAGKNCDPAFQAFVGTPIEQSSLTYYVFFPDEGSWKQKDRGMQCSLADGGNKSLTKSMKGSGY